MKTISEIVKDRAEQINFVHSELRAGRKSTDIRLILLVSSLLDKSFSEVSTKLYETDRIFQDAFNTYKG